MIDFGKLYCDLHPNEIITNFCLKQTCMIGLCATCICTHTEHHVNNKTTPEYQNIRNTFSSMHQTIRNKIGSLETQKNRIDKINQFIQTKRKALRQNIEQTRKQALAVVNNFFDNRQKFLMRQMESEQKKMGLHSEQRMQSLLNSLVRQTSLLLTSAQQLNSQNFLQSYQRIKTQTLRNATKLEDQISRELDRNQNYETIINTNEEFITEIMKALQQSIYLTYKTNHRSFEAKDYNSFLKNETLMNSEKNYVQAQPSQIVNQVSHQPILMPIQNYNDSHLFSSLTFNRMPEMTKQQTAKFYHNEQQNETTKSITFPESQKNSTLQSGRLNKSVIFNESNAVKQGALQSQVFRQKDINARPQYQSLMKSSAIFNRNHQSQVMTNEKPLGYQSSSTWYNPRQNNHQGLNQSMMQNVQHFSQQKLRNNNSYSQLNMKNQSSSNLHQFSRQTPINFQSSKKVSFVPQIYDSSQLSRNTESQVHLSDIKKMKKSGLTLLKVNHSTMRDKQQ